MMYGPSRRRAAEGFADDALVMMVSGGETRDGVDAMAQSAAASVQAWIGKGLARPFVVEISDANVIPLAYPSREPPAIVVPAHALRAYGRASLFADLIHETAHMVWHAPRSPFFSEGLAVAASYALAFADVTFPWRPCNGSVLHDHVADLADGTGLDDYLASGRREGDWRIARVPTEPQRVAYARAGSFVTWLLAEHGHARFGRLMDELSAGRAERAAFEAAFGAPFAAAEQRWIDFLASRDTRRPAAAATPAQAGADTFDGARWMAGETSWILTTDAVIGGNSSGHLTCDGDGFELAGQLGERGAFRFLTAARFMRADRAGVSLSAAEGVRFEARGDGQSYQLGVMTEQARAPGEEFMYVFAATEEWQAHRVPFARLTRFSGPAVPWTGQGVMALKLRAFGHRAGAVRVALRGLTFLAPGDEGRGRA
jgi:hypothetical protein